MPDRLTLHVLGTPFEAATSCVVVCAVAGFAVEAWVVWVIVSMRVSVCRVL
jgi:hypothetical protein